MISRDVIVLHAGADSEFFVPPINWHILSHRSRRWQFGGEVNINAKLWDWVKKALCQCRNEENMSELPLCSFLSVCLFFVFLLFLDSGCSEATVKLQYTYS